MALNLVGGTGFHVGSYFFLPAAMWAVYIFYSSKRFRCKKDAKRNLPPEVSQILSAVRILACE